MPKDIIDAFSSSIKFTTDILAQTSDVYNTHITKYIKQSMISSKVFIQQECASEPILNDVLNSLHQLYLGWILTAIDMNKMVDSTKTIRNMLDVVATESMSIDSITIHDDSTLLSGLNSFTFAAPVLPANTKSTSNSKDSYYSSTSLIDVTPKDMNLSYGKVVEVIFANPNNPKNKVSIKLFVQMIPSIIPDRVMGEFLSLNYKPNWRQRWFQVRTGEKKFFSDFLFELDLAEKRKRALAADNTGVLKTMTNELNKRTSQKYKKILTSNSNKQNIANIIHIFDKSSFNKYSTDNRIDFKIKESRERYFDSTMSMIVVTIDPYYEKIEMYFAGIDGKADYDYNQLKQQSKNSNYDLTAIMKAFSNTSAPKF